ncbi:MAG: beta-lactamase family protein, partial [Spirochaetales bacterium]|nr:beta-lactamase family protein [Spirochaetales bacterium]
MKHHYYYRMIVSSFAIMLLFIAACDKDSADNKTPKDDLQVILEQTVANENIPGAILGVKTPTDSWLVTAGKADTASAKLMNADMQVWLASVSKPLTAVLTMKLIEEKILSLDDTVEKWLPGLIPQGDQMTIKM